MSPAPPPLLSNNRPAHDRGGRAHSGQVSEVGVKVNIVSKPGPDFISLAQGDFDVILDGWCSADADVLYNTFDSSQSARGGLELHQLQERNARQLIGKRSHYFQYKLATSYPAPGPTIHSQELPWRTRCTSQSRGSVCASECTRLPYGCDRTGGRSSKDLWISNRQWSSVEYALPPRPPLSAHRRVAGV